MMEDGTNSAAGSQPGSFEDVTEILGGAHPVERDSVHTNAEDLTESMVVTPVFFHHLSVAESEGSKNSANTCAGWDDPHEDGVPTYKISDYDYRVRLCNEYAAFYWKCTELKSELTRLGFLLRPLGSAGPSILAVHNLINALCALRDLYGRNAALLGPANPGLRVFFKSSQNASLDNFQYCFRVFGESINGLSDALHEFDMDYYDDTLMLLLFSLDQRFTREGDQIDGLRTKDPSDDYWRPVLQYKIGEWIMKSLHSLIKSISGFMDKGIPTISEAQRTMISRYLNLTTIAIFMAGLTSSILNVSSAGATNAVKAISNSTLFGSLVFGVSSALLSLIAMTWKKSIIRVPSYHLPTWAYGFLDSGPMISLFLSIALFAGGLCFLAFSSGQHIATSITTICCSGLGALMVFTAISWFLVERWSFRCQVHQVTQTLLDESIVILITGWFMHVTSRLKLSKSLWRRRTMSEKSEDNVDSAPLEKADTVIQTAEQRESATSLSNDGYLLGIAAAYEEEFQTHDFALRLRSPTSRVNSYARGDLWEYDRFPIYEALSFLPSMPNGILSPHDTDRIPDPGRRRLRSRPLNHFRAEDESHQLSAQHAINQLVAQPDLATNTAPTGGSRARILADLYTCDETTNENLVDY